MCEKLFDKELEKMIEKYRGDKMKEIKYKEKLNSMEQFESHEVDKMFQNGSEITLYHGNKDKDMIPKYGVGDTNNDYGAGFYTTPDKELGKEWAWSFFTYGDKGYLHEYKLETDGLKVLDLTKLDSLHWIAELIANRTLNVEDKEVLKDRIEVFEKKWKLDTDSYDIIIGYRADDSYFTYAENFVSGLIYKETVERALRFGNLGIQVFIKSKKAFKRLEKKSIEEVPKLYMDKYKKRDKNARQSYFEIRGNQKSIRIKQTIQDFI